MWNESLRGFIRLHKASCKGKKWWGFYVAHWAGQVLQAKTFSNLPGKNIRIRHFIDAVHCSAFKIDPEDWWTSSKFDAPHIRMGLMPDSTRFHEIWETNYTTDRLIARNIQQKAEECFLLQSWTLKHGS